MRIARSLVSSRWVSHAAGVTLPFFVVLTLLATAYRLRLLAAQSDPLAAVGRPLVVGAMALPWLEDLLVGGALAAAVFLGAGLGSATRAAASAPRPARLLSRAVRGCGLGLTVALVTAVAALYQGHLGTLEAMGEGVTLALLSETASAGILESGQALLALLGPGDVLFIVVPALLLVGAWQLPRRVLRWPVGLVAGAAGGVTLLAIIQAAAGQGQPAVEAVRRNPLAFLARDAITQIEMRGGGWPALLPRGAGRALLAQRAAQDGPAQLADDALAPPRGRRIPGTARMPFAVQLTSVHFTHPLLVSSVKPKKKLPAPARSTQWNVLFVLMESTGLRYAFDESFPGGKAPMPFLSQLAARGLRLTDHYSPSNSSPRAIFALFCGLYPMPTVRIFAMSKGLHFPSIFSLLPEGYDTFMVTPAPLTWYFPHDLMARHGPRELVDYNKLPFRGRVPGKAMARDEAKTVGFFLERLDRAAERPFFAVYYSFVAHWPYPDFGPRYRRYPPTRKIHRYLNNLYLLDTQIERMVKHLEAQQLLDRTIVVVVGDHGEAFGQHKGNWTHSRHSYNENYQTPAVLYQPRLFSPRAIRQPTSHVDIAPTLLDALGIPYNPRLFQGESLFQDVLRRRYVFLYGNENTLSSVDNQGTKLQLSFRKKSCWVYDLARDPAEQRRLKCSAQPKAYEATVLFKRTQPELLRAYNAACRAGAPFHGEKHPPRATAAR